MESANVRPVCARTNPDSAAISTVGGTICRFSMDRIASV